MVHNEARLIGHTCLSLKSVIGGADASVALIVGVLQHIAHKKEQYLMRKRCVCVWWWWGGVGGGGALRTWQPSCAGLLQATAL